MRKGRNGVAASESRPQDDPQSEQHLTLPWGPLRLLLGASPGLCGEAASLLHYHPHYHAPRARCVLAPGSLSWYFHDS